MLLSTVAQLFSAIESTPKRLEMQELLTEFYSTATPEQSAIVSYLLIGRIVPEFIAIEFQLSDKTLCAVVEKLLGRDVNEDLVKYGDIGSVWEKNAVTTDATLSIEDYYENLWEIAKTRGTGSQLKKQELIIALLEKQSPLAGKYTLRIMNSKLRLGASDRTILEAVGKLQDGESEKLKQLYANCSDIGHTVYLFKKYGINAYEKSTFSPGIPVSAKLVEREDSIEAIYKRIPEPIEEPKYDGLRIQIHVFKEKALEDAYTERVWKENYLSTLDAPSEEMTLFATTEKKEEFNVMLFSRNLENMTDMFPEVSEAARKLPEQYKLRHGIGIETLVLDGEVIGYNDLIQEYLPFQRTMTRKRKHNVGDAATEVPVKVFSFDILLVNEENLMQLPLAERKKRLSFLDENQNLQKAIVKTPIHYPKTVEESEKIFLEYVTEGLEGVIYKDTNSIYTPGTRNFDWLKYKKSMKKDLADTVDIVLLGYYRGEGKLAQFGIGALLAGVYDSKNDQYLTVTKIGTGITHEQWQSIKIACDAVKTDRKLDNSVIPKALIPDVYLLPELVVEVEADEITKSPLHSSGYALRFPRFKKFREKKPEQATSLDELNSLVK
ncbi:ATP-dependent DNA ligase [bacterium]|nr:ATP-dependent DNA ligase [bacterium]